MSIAPNDPNFITVPNPELPTTTIEDIKKQQSDDNPNILYDDIYQEGALGFLAQADTLYRRRDMGDPGAITRLKLNNEHYLDTYGESYDDYIDRLLEKQAAYQPPLETPPIPESVQERLQPYINILGTYPEGTAPKEPRTPEEVEAVLKQPGMNWDKFLEDANYLQKTAHWSLDTINWIDENWTKWGRDLNKWKEKTELGTAGIPYEEGAPLSERFRASQVARGYQPGTVQDLARDVGLFSKGDPTGTAEFLYPGRPLGEQGPIIRKTRDPDTGEVVKVFPFNEPDVTGGDWAHFVTREAFPITGDVAATVLVQKYMKSKRGFYKKPGTKMKELGAYSAAAGFGTAFFDFNRAAIAVATDIDPDLDFFEAARESGLIGLYATAGSAGVLSILNGMKATWNFFTNKHPPAFIVHRLVELRQDYQISLKNAGIKEGTPEAQAILDDYIGQLPDKVAKRMKEVTGRTYRVFLGEKQVGPDSNFALALLDEMANEGIPASKAAQELYQDIVNNEYTRRMFAYKILFEEGDLGAAQKTAAELGEVLQDDVIPKLLIDDMETMWVQYAKMIEEGQADDFILKSLGIDDAAYLGLKPAAQKLPGTLTDESAVGRHAFEEIADPDSMMNAFRNPMIRRLYKIQRDYMKEPNAKMINITKKYKSLGENVNPSSPFSKEISKILKGGTTQSILKRDKQLAEWLRTNLRGKDTSLALNRLQGFGPKHKIGGDRITFQELHDLTVDLHALRNSVGGSIREPSKRAIDDLIRAVEKQQQLLLLKSASAKSKIPFTYGKPSKRLRDWMNDNKYGTEYWDIKTEYRRASELANNRFINNLLSRGKDWNESLIPSLFGTKGDSISHPIGTPLMKILRESGDEGLDMIDHIQRGIAARYKKEVLEPFQELKDYRGMKVEHERWMKKNGGLIKAAFPDEDYNVWNTINSTQRVVKTLAEKREQFIKVLRAENEELSQLPPGEMILRIVRGDTLENASGSRLRRDKLLTLLRRADDGYENEIQRVIAKDIYNQIIELDVPGAGGLGYKKLKPQALNDLITKDYPLISRAGKPDMVSFEKMYEGFLPKKTIRDLIKLNSAVQQEVRREGRRASLLSDVAQTGAKQDVDISRVGKLIFGPLNPYTYRFGWRQRALYDATQELLAEAVADPKLLDKILKASNRKMTLDQAVRFFYSLDSVTAHDIGRDLQADYLNAEEVNPWYDDKHRSNFLEFWRIGPEKRRPPASGFIPGRELIEQGVPITGSAAGATVMGVYDTGKEFFDTRGVD